MKSDILAFLASQALCSVATVNADGKPEAAYVGFSEKDDMKLYFGTSNQTRKYQNLIANKNVAVVIADTAGEVQYEGIATEITDQAQKQQIEARHIQKVPGAKQFLNDESQVYFEITPTWLRFVQHGDEYKVTEMTEF